MMSLLERTHPLWGDFLRTVGEAAVPALEEFLLDLSHEQILEARAVGLRDGRREGGQHGAPAHARPPEGQPPVSPPPDPREFYRFFRRRRKNAVLRRRAGVPGPRKTIEEMLLATCWEAGRTRSGWPTGRRPAQLEGSDLLF
jgi:hypothetical protein